VEGLEAMTLLSAAPLAAVQAPVQTLPVTLDGNAQGGYFAHQANSATSYSLVAEGQVTPLGPAIISASFSSPAGDGVAEGTLTIRGASGSITMKIAEFPTPSASAINHPAFEFAYTITGGTGAYANADGRGLVYVQLSPADFVGDTSFGGATVQISPLATPLA
jgi:hypothetical protein